ncbi:MAG TPA: gliding motility-associated C-terminal domain-containing protein, partial [Bacteroidales bacterium]|nr:gliding motility-associated C-terminal domain-containing protein [Bacteroidales bacterium]
SQAKIRINSPASALNLVLDPQDLRCYQDNSGVIDLAVTGGTLPYNYSWSNGYTGEDLVNVPGGTYTITLTDANNCTAQASAELDEPGAIGLDITVTGTILCYGEQGISATANITGGIGSFTYLWDDPGNQTTKTAFDLPAGTFTVIVADENGCTRSASTTLLEPDPLTIVADLTEPSCPGSTNGAIVPTVSGGTPGFEYVWSNSVFTRVNPNLLAGTYTLTVTDDNNCTLIQDFTLSNPDTLKIVSVDITDITCAGLDDGSMTINATGGTGVLEYSADGGLNFVASQTISSLAGGNYIAQVKDGNACISENYPVSLIVADTLKIVSVEVSDLTCSGIDDGSLTITATGGNGIYEYSIDAGLNYGTSSTIGSLGEDDYDIMVMDGQGCISENYPVTVSKSGTCGLVIYDAFSPNDDGMNDVWHIGNSDNFPDCTVSIFNLWGTTVFTSNGYGVPWDGKHNGNDLPAGTYYYVIDPGDGSGSLSGPVSIVK